MRNKNLWAFALLLAGLNLFQACLKNQTDYFDTSAAERMQKVITEMKDILCKPENGWRMEYFIGNVDQDRGGRNVALKFYSKADSVQIMSEEKKDTMITSWYKLSTDDGPVLSFDTYNEVFHKYAVPSSSYYEARGGDFEFIIISYSDEKIVLKGKRSGKISTLYPLNEPMDVFIPRIADKSKNFYVSSFTGTFNGKAVKGEIDIPNHQFTIEEVLKTEDDKIEPKKETLPYIITENGLQFYEPVEFLDASLSEINFNKVDTSFVASGFEAKGYIPDDWRPYDFFPGTYLFTHASGSVTIKLTPMGDEEDMYKVTGLSDQFDLYFGYDIRSGRLTLEAQFVAEPGTEIALKEGKNYILLVPLSTNSFFGTDSEYGMCAKWNKSETSPKYDWVDKGLAPRFITDTYYLRLYNGGYVRDDDGYTVGPYTTFFKGNSSTLSPRSMSKFAQ